MSFGVRGFSGTKVSRAGKRYTVRSMADWRKALDGHRKSAHAGELRLSDCAGCRELTRRVKSK